MRNQKMRDRLPAALVGMLAAGILAFAVSARADLPAYSARTVQSYLEQLSTQLAGRPLNENEIGRIGELRSKAIEEILTEWIYGGYFPRSAKIMIQTQLLTSGSNSGIDYDLPGNLAKYLARNDLAYSTLLTADYCVDSEMNKIGCDTGAPYTAGILTTRAFMRINQGRFNLGRANKLLRYFACKEYPLDTALQPPLAKSRLIPLFQTEKAMPGADFGNGLVCYTCHSQFGAHAQFFVKFDEMGVWRGDASGIQNPALEAGKSFDELYASHLSNPAESASERSQMFGKDSANLSEAAKALASTDMFLECATRNALRYFLRMTDSEAAVVDIGLIRSVVQRVKKVSKDPSLNQILLTALTHPVVIESVLSSGERK
jgi:hypothetical protein